MFVETYRGETWNTHTHTRFNILLFFSSTHILNYFMFFLEMKMEEMNPWKGLWGIFVLEKLTRNKTNWCYWNPRMTGSFVWSDPWTTPHPSPNHWAIRIYVPTYRRTLGTRTGPVATSLVKGGNDSTIEIWRISPARWARLMIQASMSTWTHFSATETTDEHVWDPGFHLNSALRGMTFIT